MKSLLSICFICLTSVLVFAQDQVGDMIPLADFPESKNLLDYTEQYAQAIITSDFNRLVELTHDEVLEKGGGKDFMIKDLSAEAEMLASQGFIYSDLEIGNHPEFFTSEEQLQTVVPVKFFMTYNGNKAESVIDLFAVSEDEGKTWKFVNLERYDEESLRSFVSNVSADLVYPK